MKSELSPEDYELIDILRENCGLSKIEAWVFILTISRPIARSITVPRLIEVLKLYHYYDVLVSEEEINRALKGLIDKRLFSIIETGNENLITCSDPASIVIKVWGESKDTKQTQEKAVSLITRRVEKVSQGFITIVGPATSKEASQSFMQAIDNAKREIKLPVFSTRSHGALRNALDRAISRGARVKVLMYSPKAAKLTYGRDYDQEIRMMGKQWRNELKELNRRGPGSIKIRMVDNLNHLHFSGGVIIDGEQFRYGIRYPDLHWGHEAIVFTGRNVDGESSNLQALLEYYFDLAWSKAIPLDYGEKILFYLTFGLLPK